MKLTDKFSKAECEKYIKHHNINLKVECTKIAEGFAIGFAEWLSDNNTHEVSIIELLEIYKKEKGL